MTAFAAAFLSLCFKDSNLATRISIGATVAGILIVVLWTVGISIQLSLTLMSQELKRISARITRHIRYSNESEMSEGDATAA